MTGDAGVISRLRLAGSVADQISWSAAFFLFNASVGVAAPEHFAQVAVATAVGLVALAVVRSWVVDSSVLFAGFPRSATVTIRSNLIAGLVASAAYAGWVTLSDTPVDSSALCLAFAIVFGDNARYAWITRGELRRSFPVSALYFVSAGLGTLGTWAGWSGESVTWIWAGSLTLLGLAGLTDRAEVPNAKLHQRDYARHRNSLTLEALYFMFAAQVGLLALSVTATADQVAGFRLAYAVALAPAALLIQGLGTQLLRRQGELRGTRQGLRLAIQWGAASAAIYAANTIAVLGSVSLVSTPSLSLAVPYMVPLCAFLAASSMSNSVHTVLRYHVSPTTSQSVKLLALASDVGLQVAGVVIAGQEGLIVGLYAAASARVMLWLAVTRWCSRESYVAHG